MIRATDGKVTALTFGLALPLTKLGSIWTISFEVWEGTAGEAHVLADIVLFVFAAAWLTSITAALRTLFHIDNPADHVTGDTVPTGVFYSGGLFRIPLSNVYFPRSGRRPTAHFAKFFQSLPSTETEIRRELSFELMKLIYIRSIKLKRADVAYCAFFAWLVAGGLIWIAALYLRNYGS